jgi:hypothetical protein
MEQFPENITDLKKLRYLCLPYSWLQKLPDNIGEMKTLQEMIFLETQIKTLPPSITELNDLRRVLESEKVIALAALEVADKSLGVLKFTLGAAGHIAMFIIKNGSKLLVNVRAASFEGKLSGLDGGLVSISCDLEWMRQRQKVNLNFDFSHPAKSVKVLAKSLIK